MSYVFWSNNNFTDLKQYAISGVSGNWFISQIPDFFHFAKSRFFFISQNPDSQACDLVFRQRNSPLECKLFLLSERLITSYVYLCLILKLVHFAKSRFFFISQNPVFFSFHKIQIYRLATSFSDSENSPLECTLFLLSERSITLYVYLCLIFTIGSFRKIQIFFTDLQQTVCGCNWFISQNPDIFFISQNPDFINVVENVDFAKSRFFLFRRIQIFFYFTESIFRNFAKSIFRKIQLAIFTTQPTGTSKYESHRYF